MTTQTSRNLIPVDKWTISPSVQVSRVVAFYCLLVDLSLVANLSSLTHHFNGIAQHLIISLDIGFACGYECHLSLIVLIALDSAGIACITLVSLVSRGVVFAKCRSGISSLAGLARCCVR